MLDVVKSQSDGAEPGSQKLDDNVHPDFRAPEHRSLRARLVTRIVHAGVKYWPREDPEKLARSARKVFELPNILGVFSARGMRIECVQDGRVRGEWISLHGRRSGDAVLFYLHGGGYISCSAKSHRSITASMARRLGQPVFSLDYRLAPEHPFPAAVEDAVSAYQWLLDQGIPARRIAIAGDSAGGGLAISTMLRLRQSNTPLPACAVCLSPWVDLTGECEYGNGSSESVFRARDIIALGKHYLHGTSAKHPEASPIFGDLSGLPPLLIFASRGELLADDAIRLHARAKDYGVESTLLLYPDLPHVWQIYGSTLPEARLALQQAASFITATWKKSDENADPDLVAAKKL